MLQEQIKTQRLLIDTLTTQLEEERERYSAAYANNEKLRERLRTSVLKPAKRKEDEGETVKPKKPRIRHCRYCKEVIDGFSCPKGECKNLKAQAKAAAQAK